MKSLSEWRHIGFFIKYLNLFPVQFKNTTSNCKEDPREVLGYYQRDWVSKSDLRRGIHSVMPMPYTCFQINDSLNSFKIAQTLQRKEDNSDRIQHVLSNLVSTVIWLYLWNWLISELQTDFRLCRDIIQIFVQILFPIAIRVHFVSCPHWLIQTWWTQYTTGKILPL